MSSPQWLQILSSLFVQTSIVIALAWFIDSKTTDSRSRVNLWNVSFISLLMLIFAALVLPRLQLINPWSQVAPNVVVDVVLTEHAVGVTMVAVWFLGTVAVLARWILNHIRFHRLISQCKPISQEQASQINELVDHQNLIVCGRRISFLCGPEDWGPFCYQLHQPLVVLPESVLEGEPVDLKNVLVHELTHLRSRHPMQLFIQRIVQALLWFQPLVWRSGKRFAIAREFECDDMASGNPQATISYLKTLIKVVENRPPLHSGTMPINRNRSQLRERAQRLANRVPTDTQTGWPIGVVAIAIVAVTTSQLWLPINPLASPRSQWSAWPTWTAAALHELNMPVRDFELFDSRTQLHELMDEALD